MINKEKIMHIARIARVDLSDAETDAFAAQLSSVLEYVSILDTADVAGVEPTCYTVPAHDPLRDDTEIPSLAVDTLLQNGPVVKKGHFAVPKVIGSKAGV